MLNHFPFTPIFLDVKSMGGLCFTIYIGEAIKTTILWEMFPANIRPPVPEFTIHSLFS